MTLHRRSITSTATRAVLRAAVASLLLMACARTAPPALRAAADGGTTVIVVRHAEKAAEPVNDQALSALGIARAESLGVTLRQLEISDVVVSHLQRTRLTAAAIMRRPGVTLHVVPITAAGAAAHIAAVADTVRAIAAKSRQRGVLVVGHSNTVTQIVAALGGGAYPALCDSQYAQLFAVQLRRDGAATSTRTTYGAADPADPTCAAMSAPAK